MGLRVLVFALAMCAVPCVVMAETSKEGDAREYAAYRDMDVSSCKVASLSSRVSQSAAANSPEAVKAQHEYWDCLSKTSREAKANLPKALNSTKSKDVKEALKNLYVTWSAYMGDLDNRKSSTLKDNYETAKRKLDVELLSE